MHNTYYYTYPFTNEPLNEIIPLLPVRNANVLTITASGDQTLFFHAYGAKHIDTVDFSIGALVITDIKIAAIKSGMKCDIFYDYIVNLSKNNNSKILELITPFRKHMVQKTITYLESNPETYIFLSTLAPKHKLTTEQYNKIQSQGIPQPGFTLCDINDIHKHTNK